MPNFGERITIKGKAEAPRGDEFAPISIKKFNPTIEAREPLEAKAKPKRVSKIIQRRRNKIRDKSIKASFRGAKIKIKVHRGFDWRHLEFED